MKPIHKLSNFHRKQLGVHVGKISSYVKYSRHFVQTVKLLRLKTSDLSLSVSRKIFAYQCASIGDHGVDKKNVGPSPSTDGTDLTKFDGQFNEQMTGAAMGSSLLPVQRICV